jgi:hypothetical protein
MLRKTPSPVVIAKANQNPSVFGLHTGLKGDGVFLQIDCEEGPL